MFFHLNLIKATISPKFCVFIIEGGADFFANQLTILVQMFFEEKNMLILFFEIQQIKTT